MLQIWHVQDLSVDDAWFKCQSASYPDVHFVSLLWQGRLKPGRMLLVDTKEKVFMRDEVLKANIASLRPVSNWLEEVSSDCNSLY